MIEPRDTLYLVFEDSVVEVIAVQVIQDSIAYPQALVLETTEDPIPKRYRCALSDETVSQLDRFGAISIVVNELSEGMLWTYLCSSKEGVERTHRVKTMLQRVHRINFSDLAAMEPHRFAQFCHDVNDILGVFDSDMPHPDDIE